MVWEEVVAGGSPTDVVKPPRFVAMGNAWISPILHANGDIILSGKSCANGVFGGDSFMFSFVGAMVNGFPFTNRIPMFISF